MSINGETFLAGSSRLRCALRMSDFRKRLLQKTKECTLCLNPAHYASFFATYTQKHTFLLKMNTLGRQTKVLYPKKTQFLEGLAGEFY